MSDAHQILTQFQDQLHALSSQLLSGVAINGDPWIRGDDPTPAGDGTQEWPSRWEYTVNVIVAGGGDARPQAQRIVDQLRADGWHLRDDFAAPQDSLGVIAQRDGFGLNVQAGSGDGILQIDAYSPRVSRDGHVDRHEVS